MSLTPVDEPDGVSGSGDDPDSTSGASVLDRVRRTVRSVSDTLGRRLRSLAGADDSPAEPSEPDDSGRPAAPIRPDGTDSGRYTGLTAEVIEGPGAEVSGLPDQRSADPVDRDGPEHDPPKLEATWDDGRLRLDATDSEAHISSDHWEDVEP